MPDFEIEDHSIVVILKPCNPAAVHWLQSHAPEGAMFWHSNLVLAPERLDEMVRMAEADGWKIECKQLLSQGETQ